MQDSDSHLLALFATHRDEAAFRELTARHLGLIYYVALRRTGNRQMAEEVSQNVLCAVVRKAAGLAKHPDRLPAWLHRATLFESSKAMRAEASHERRKQLVHPDGIASTASDGASAWKSAMPLLDLALDRLSDRDRNLVLKHYFEGKSFVEVGGESGLPTATVQKQCRRALEKLARILRGKGVVLSATALASGLATQSAKAAPAQLLKSAAAQALAGASGYSATPLTLFMATKSKAALPIALLVLLSPLAFQELAISKISARNESLRLSLFHPDATAGRVTERTTRRTVSTGTGRITIEMLQRALKQGDRSLLKRLEFGEMLAALDGRELEALIPQASALSVPRPERDRLSQSLVEELAKTDPGAAVKATFRTENFRESLDEWFLQAALIGWASSHPDEAIEWFKEVSASYHDKSGLDLLPLRGALARVLILSGSPRVREILADHEAVRPAYVIRNAAGLTDPHASTGASLSAVDLFFRFLPWIREFLPEKPSDTSGYADQSQVISVLLHERRSAPSIWEDPTPGKIMESGSLRPNERRIIAEYHAFGILESSYITRRPAPPPLKMEAMARDWLEKHIPEASGEIFETMKARVMERQRQRIERTIRGLSQRGQLRDDEITQALDRHDLAAFPDFIPRAIEQAGRIKDPLKRAVMINRLQSTDTPKPR